MDSTEVVRELNKPLLMTATPLESEKEASMDNSQMVTMDIFFSMEGGINSRNEMKMRSKAWATCKWKNLNTDIMESSPQGSSGSL